MKIDMNINVHHLTRVEGHGDIHIKVADGKLQQATWSVVETPRFFEVMLKGQEANSAHLLTARICGICSIGHALASLRASENALGIGMPPLAAKMRLLAKHGETLQSHVLHLLFLVAPDFFNASSAIPLVNSHPREASASLNLKRMANELCDLIAGRTTHPVNFSVGGVNRMPDKYKIQFFLDKWKLAESDLKIFVDLVKSLPLPEFIRETEFVALGSQSVYPWIGGDLVSTDRVTKKEADYRAMTNEYVVDFSTSKHTKLSRPSFAVGALARFNNNYNQLLPQAKSAAKEIGLRPINQNPFMNNAAQLIECIHIYYETITLLEELLDTGKNTVLKNDAPHKTGIGVGAVEVPRGILYHEYELDKEAKVVRANCIIPTTQNNGNIHLDLAELVQYELKKGKKEKEIEHLAEMLVRAYDPCISCSVH